MVICNIFVWTFFVKALHEHGGSVVATVTSTATNYCFSVNWKIELKISSFEFLFETKRNETNHNSTLITNWILNFVRSQEILNLIYWFRFLVQAIVGNWIFGEQVTVLWWFGTSLVVIGLVFVSLGNKDQIENTKITETTKKTK